MSTRTTLALVFAALASSCAVQDELRSRDAARDVLDAARDALGLDGTSFFDGASSADSARDSAPDAPPMGDSLPRDTVMFFDAMTCPMGWETYNPVAGRVVVAAAMGAMGGAVSGNPLADAEDRAHTHQINETFLIDAVAYVGIAGGSNNGVATADDPTVMVRSEPASAGLPYVQLLACRKTTAAVPRVVALPSGMMIYVAGASCPPGFSQPMSTVGRAVVGTPMTGENLAAVGPSADQLASRTHRHAVSATLNTAPHGIALSSGCCGMGFARNGAVTADSPSSEEDGALPSLTLVQCQKD